MADTQRRRRSSAAPRKARRGIQWSDVAPAEAEHFELVHRVLESHRHDASVDHLIRVECVVRQLWKDLDQGKDVAALSRDLFRAANGRGDEKTARRALMIAVARVADHSDEAIGQLLWCGDPEKVPSATDEQLAGMVCIYLKNSELVDVADRLQRHPAEVARAVRLWRRKAGRPRKGEPTGSKWSPFPDLARLGRMTIVDEKCFEQTWKEHGVEMG